MKTTENYNELLAKRVIKGLSKRRMAGYYVKTKTDAVKKVLELIPEKSVVSWGGSESVNQINLLQEFKKGDYNLLDRDEYDKDNRREFYSKVFMSDYYLMSTNAMTEDGVLVNIDGIGNRIASLIIGPENVIIITSLSKVCKDVESAVYRARNIAAPKNTMRLGRNTPCVVTGVCANCNGEESICSDIVITRHSMIKDRIKVILIEEEIGY